MRPAGSLELTVAFNLGELSPRGREIVAAARELLEDGGLEALTMRSLAQRLGIQAPSIYKHLPDKDALEAALISAGFEQQAAALDAAVEDTKTDDRIGALAGVYRTFAHDHPHLYRLMTERALNHELLAPGSEQRAAEAVYEVAGGNVDLARAIWAFMHGMTVLELNHRFSPGADLDAAWEQGINALRAAADAGSAARRRAPGLRRQPRSQRPAPV